MKAVVALSGGLDSTVLAYKLAAEGHDLIGMSVAYGQRHARELLSARAVAASLGIECEFVDLSALRPVLGGSSQTSTDVAVPEGHYADESMKVTVVPNRNMILLAVAGALAVSRKADAVAYAAHGGDHAIYPDCRPEFVSAMMLALGRCDWRKQICAVACSIAINNKRCATHCLK